MGTRAKCRLALVVGALFFTAGFVSGPVWADNVKLDSVKLDGGGSLTGSVTTGSKLVTVRTSSGALVEFDRSAVKQVHHGPAGAAKTAATTSSAKTAGAKVQPKKRKLTAEEETWMPKVHSLVGRLTGSNREKAAQAHNSLLSIDDPDAIPALSKYFGSSRDEASRHLYVVVLHNMKGAKPVYYLVALSLFDSSPQIRAEARKAIRADQYDAARRLYIAALRSGPPHLARLAAIAIGEIGDPRGDSVPYLINALVSYGTIATMTEPAQYNYLYSMTVMATPGLNFSGMTFNIPNSGASYVGTGKSPIYLTPSGMAQAQAALQKATGPGQSLGIGGTIYIQGGNSFGQASSDFTPNSKGMPDVHWQEMRKAPPAPPPGLGSPSADEDVYSLPVYGMVAPSKDRKIKGKADHPEVLDALLKITDQKYPGHGFNQDHWRSWWATEKINRDLQKPAAPDRAVPGNSATH
jgi:hypothetical protein